MKLSVGDIKFSESYASTTVEVETGTYPFLSLTICKMHVSVPLVEGKALEQYKDELLGKARERISGMYKEIVCDGQNAESLLNMLVGKIKPTEISQKILYDISMQHADLEKRIASIEKQLSGSQDTGALNAIYAVGKKAAVDFLSQKEKRPKEEALDGKALKEVQPFKVEPGMRPCTRFCVNAFYQK
ncbi:hypothetical protein OOL67_001983 [Salmonella enterica]|nr:hypothetical protein [Salmonella enterica]EKC2498241.1 hypothetical protein [Salmonella enterica]EKC2521573.1 hypothetical protein [Salmonella enterica]EMD4816366.1 hypothetical protein [Salmonella enterica]EMD6006985.1 hypothetical protein [Salmonella enterica]